LSGFAATGSLASELPTREVPIQVLIVTGITVVLVLLAVGVHYEALSRTSNGIRRLRLAHRIRVAIAVLAALTAHFVEIILFAVGWMILLAEGAVELSIDEPTFVEILYFSASTYTSLGYGDIVPLGDSGLLAGSQALTGLVLIAWTASFTYFEMLRVWGSDSGR
jgi:hypothetical protein